MAKQTLVNSIKRSMQVSVAQVRCSLGRTSSVATREQVIKQEQMLHQAKLAKKLGDRRTSKELSESTSL